MLTKRLLTISFLLPLVAMSATAHAGETITSKSYWPSEARQSTARDYRYCIQGEYYGGGTGDCSFTSYQQCQASASGRTAYCGANPWFPKVAPLGNQTRTR